MTIVDGRLFVCRLFVVILPKYFMLTELYHGINIAVKSVFVVVQNLLHHKDIEVSACVLEVCKYRAYLFWPIENGKVLFIMRYCNFGSVFFGRCGVGIMGSVLYGIVPWWYGQWPHQDH